MIIELNDIINSKVVVGHTQPPPQGITLGEIFDKSSVLQQLVPNIVQVKLNEVRIEAWRQIQPGQHDHIEIDIVPRTFGGLTGLALAMAYVSAITAVASVIMTIVSIFMRPRAAKMDYGKESTTYSWEGIKTSFTPGGPVPVIYGEHLAGGQLLSLAVDVNPDHPDRQQLAMLTGVGAGPITNVSCIRINNIPISNFVDPTAEVCQAAADRFWAERPDVAADPYYGSSPQAAYDYWSTYGPDPNFPDVVWHGELCTVNNVSWDWRSGVTSQSIIPGYEMARNTFADGREISSLAITYTSVGNDIERIQLQVGAMQGLGIMLGGTNPRLATQTVFYNIEWKDSGLPTWHDWATPRIFPGASRGEVWDAPVIDFGYRGSFLVRLTFIGYDFKERGPSKGDVSMHRIWLRNVTEISGAASQSFSSTALLSIKAIATNQLQGGAPNVTAMVQGRKVKAYSDETTYVETWTANPAWCLLDYMCNSRYGMGAFITTSKLNMQSFIDFASLCSSQVPDGAGGYEAQHRLDIVMDKRRPHWQWVTDILGLYNSSIIFSQGKFKIITERADAVMRQVFHSGNIVPGTFQLTMGTTDPIKPNQAVVTFTNRSRDYNLDPIYVQDSASVYGANEPIKEFEISLMGIARESEAVRTGRRQLETRRRSLREARFKTGLEAIAVEPGDLCKVGIATTNFELGWGGRVLEGDQDKLVLDREVEVRSGSTYEFFLWHTNNDSLEARIVDNVWPGVAVQPTIVIYPTLPFAGLPAPGDRWAMGVSSEDLMAAWVKKVSKDDAGLFDITVEQASSISVAIPDITTPSWWGIIDLNDPPPQPISVVGSVQLSQLSDGTLVGLTTIDVVPAPREEGGYLRQNSAINSNPNVMLLELSGSHSPAYNANYGDYMRFLPPWIGASVDSVHAWRGQIAAWYGSNMTTYVSPALNPSGAVYSGCAYEIIHKGGNWAGFDLYAISTAQGYSERLVASQFGTHWEELADVDSLDVVGYRIIPFNSMGRRNWTGTWSIGMTLPGYGVIPDTPSGLKATANAKGVVLSWNANSEPFIRDYGIFRNTANAFGTSSLIARSKSNLFLDSGATVDTSYAYWIRAYNTIGLASPVHPGSTSGVTAKVNPISNFLEYVTTDPFSLPYGLNPNSSNAVKELWETAIVSLSMVNYGGNLTWDVEMDVQTTSWSGVLGGANAYMDMWPVAWQNVPITEWGSKQNWILMAGSQRASVVMGFTDVATPGPHVFAISVYNNFDPDGNALKAQYMRMILWETAEG